MSNTIKFYPKDAAKNPDAVLEQAIGEYQSLLIIGMTHEGELSARASLDMDETDALWIMEKFKHWLLTQDEGDT